MNTQPSMMEQKRGRNVALMGAMLQGAFAVVMIIIAAWTTSPSAWACAWLLGGGLALWLMTALLMYCRELAEREAAELEQLSQDQADASTIFADEQADAHHTAQKRVDVMLKWVAPIFTLLWAGFNGVIGYLMLDRIRTLEPALATQTGQAALFGVLIGFVAFLFSFYALGMSRQSGWRPLRAPANYLLICVLIIAGVLAGLIASQQEYGGMDRVMAYLIPILQLVLAFELALTFVLDKYRPRMPGTEQRLVYDSRLFGLVGQWRRFGQAMAEAINYQFGFEVSTTWFFRLLGRAITPLMLIGAASLLLMSSIVLVDQGEVAVISHLGRIDTSREPLGPGIHFKWPWPIATARHFDLRVRTLPIGTGELREKRTDIVEGGTFAGRELSLWTVEHGERVENNFLVAVPPRDQADEQQREKVPPVNIIRLVGSLHYRVSNPYRFGYIYTDAETVLSDLAHQEMVQYCSSATLFAPEGDSPGGNRPEAIMTYGRERLVAELERRIRQAVAAPGVDLGVEIVSLNIRTVHPPTEAADAYEQVLQARLGQEVQRFEAQAQSNKRYFSVATEPGNAQKLAIWRERATALASLASLAEQGRDVRPQLAQVLHRVDNHIADLQEELQREALLGEMSDEETVTAQLISLLTTFKQQLELIRDDAEARQPLTLTTAAGQAADRADELFEATSGEPAGMTAEARAEFWAVVLQERGRSAAFPAQLKAYRASPRVYALDRYLDVWDQVLPGVQKYVIGLDPNRLEPWLNLEQGGSFHEQIQFSQGGSGE